MRNIVKILLLLVFLPTLVLADTPAFIRHDNIATPLPYADGQVSHATVNQFGTENVLINSALQTPVPVTGSVTTNPSTTPIAIYTPSASIPIVPKALSTSGTLDMTNAASAVSLDCDGMSLVSYVGGRVAETGQVKFQLSPDNATWTSLPVFNDIAGAQGLSGASSGIVNVTSLVLGSVYWQPMLPYRYVRAAVSTTGAGAAMPIAIHCSSGPVPVLKEMIPGTGGADLGKASNGNWGTADTGVTITTHELDILAAGNGTGRYNSLTTDGDQRVYVNDMGSDPSHTLNGVIATPLAVTTPQAVFTATTAIRYYIQDWGCHNTGTTASQVLLEDGSAILDSQFVPSNAVTQPAMRHFTMPQRGTAATALNIVAVTTGSALVCTVHGYTSAN